MVTYEFYKNTYLGSQIREAEFPSIVARAEEYVAYLERQYQVRPMNTDSRSMAVCAVADQMTRKNNVSAATVGTVSVRYFEDKPRQQLLRAVRPYLAICRGVG